MEERPHVVLFPYPVQGHINPMFTFARSLASLAIEVTFVHTAGNYELLQQQQQRRCTGLQDDNSPDDDQDSRNIHVEAIPEEESKEDQEEIKKREQEDPCYEHSMQRLERGFEKVVGRAVQRLQGRGLVKAMVADVLMPWTRGVAKRAGIQHWYHFSGYPALTYVVGYYVPRLIDMGLLPLKPGTEDTCLDFLDVGVPLRLGDVPLDFLRRDLSLEASGGDPQNIPASGRSGGRGGEHRARAGGKHTGGDAAPPSTTLPAMAPPCTPPIGMQPNTNVRPSPVVSTSPNTQPSPSPPMNKSPSTLPSPSTGTGKSPNTQTSPTCAITNPGASSEVTGGRKRKSTEIWSPSEIIVLIDLYEDKWISLNRGNLKAKHWCDIVRDLNAKCGTDFSDTQCKNKWENMKKTFMKERQKESSSGTEPSRWEHFSRMVDLLGGTPKVRGLMDGYTGEDFVANDVVSLTEEDDVTLVDEDGHPVPPSMSAAAAEEGDGGTGGSVGESSTPKAAEGVTEDGVPGPAISHAVKGQRTKKRRTAIALEGLGSSMKESVGVFATAFKEVEVMRLQTQLEMETRRLQNQLEIARLFALASTQSDAETQKD